MTQFFAPAECGVQHPDSFFIGGEWVKAQGSAWHDVISPATEEVVARVPDATPAEIDAAVRAAHRALNEGPWGRTTPAERAELMRKLAAKLREHAAKFNHAVIVQVGTPVMFAPGNVEALVTHLEANAKLIEEMAFELVRERENGYSVIVREPVGVVAAIAPWNSPLMLGGVKVAMALASGSTIILKPAPETPLEALILAQCVEEVGFPAGVYNVIQAGRESGEHLVSHPLVDKVAFTGSTAAGKRIGAICAGRVARYSLELGGKSAALVMEDIPVSDVIASYAPATMFGSGQVCACLTRLVVPRAHMRDYEEAFSEAVTRLPLGDPFDPNTFIGPVTIERQRERIEGYIAKGKAEGARLVTGGGRPKHLNRGYYVEPTLFSDVTNDMTIAQEEIFGPVISLIGYDSEEEAVRIANDSDFGLNGAVYSSDADRAYRLMRQVRAGNMTHNGWTYDHRSPFGGFKQSGVGREGGPEGLDGYFELKTIYMDQLPSHLR